METLINSLVMIAQPGNFLWLAVGTFIGIFFGAIPGINGLMAAILFVPFTYSLGPIYSILALVGIYQGSNFGGCITAVLFNIPGDPAAVCTTFDGHPMAKKGQAGKAIGAGLFGSAIGGLVGTFFLILLGPYIAKIALKFGPTELFSFIFLGLMTISSISGDSFLNGLLSLFLGLLVASIGLSPMTGVPRFVFNSDYLLGGIDFIVALMGLFALSEVFDRLDNRNIYYQDENIAGDKIELPNWSELKSYLISTIPRSSILGTIVGAIPGAGTVLGSIMSYGLAKQFSKDGDKFGTGIAEGVVAPECANNACAAGAVLTMLTLGIPGSAVTAIILGAFLIAGLNPGPMIFLTNPEIVHACFGGMLLVNILVLALGLLMTRMFVKATKLPVYILDPLIIVFSYIGVFSLRSSFSDIMIMTLFGIIGYVLKRLDLSIGPMVLALVLGPLAEKNFVLATRLSDDGIFVFFTRPISLVMLICAVITLSFPMLKKKLMEKSLGKKATASIEKT
jgi:putative tricarboxylic transport membrane protein